jgi:hypothetical protein
MDENKLKFPTEMVELPSKGLVYPESNPLSKGTVEMKYMTAKEEDILTNQAYIKKGIVFDKLLKSLITTPGVSIEDLVVGDKNALLIAARILGYGAEYKFTYLGKDYDVDLTSLNDKVLDETLFTKGKNEFSYTLPFSKVEVTFKLPTGKDEKEIEMELESLKKINKDQTSELTTRLKHIITSINGDGDKKTIREFIDDYLLAKDSREFRKYLANIQPDIVTKTTVENMDGLEEEIEIPIGINFFWPES